MTQQIKMFEELESNPVSKPKNPSLKWYEEDYPELDFILLPVACLVAVFNDGRKIPKSTSDKGKLLIKVFGAKDKNCLDKIRQYIEVEAKYIKKDSTKKLSKKNCLSKDEFEEIILRGASMLFSKNGLQNDGLYIRKQLPVCTPPLCFSKVPRFILNGLHDRYWYSENAIHLTALFSNFSPKLIFDLFAATAIRSSVKSNIRKALKALHQFHENKERDVMIGEKGKKTMKRFHFKGFLDAQVYQLQNIKDGKEIGNGKQNKSRKTRNFSNAMQGTMEAIVTDIWLTRAFNTDVVYPKYDRLLTRSPTSRQYDAIEWYLQTIARIAYLEPRELSAIVWSGIRTQLYSDQTRYTHFLDQMFSHGLFEEQYGPLVPTENGIMFSEKS